MESNPLRSRRISLEEAFARQVEAVRFRSLWEQGERDRARAELGAELEIEDEALLERLIELGIRPDTAPAFEAIPLVEVAWADGAVDREERWRALASASAFGLELGRPAHAQLELWLRRRPEPAIFDAWVAFAELGLARPAAAARARRVLAAAFEVARAAGGVLGLGRISAAEREVIERIRRALGRHARPAVPA